MMEITGKGNKLRCPNCHTLNQSKFKYLVLGFKVYVCAVCLNGFINPVPSKMDEYYPDNYWQVPGLFGKLKGYLNELFQKRRIAWIKQYLAGGKVLDVGSGEGLFAKKLTGFKAISIDTPGSKIKNPEVLKVDLLKLNQTGFDAIVFWESLEHVPDPDKYLTKTQEILKKGGYLFIECPRMDSFESLIFSQNWYHLDPPRHLVQFSLKGLKKILQNKGFKIIKSQSVFAPEYLYPGFLVSLLNSLGFDPINTYLKKNSIFWILLISVLLMPFAVIFESVLYLVGNSPIMLIIARKK